MASSLQQIGAITATTLRSLPARWGVAVVVVICLAGVSGVMISMLAMADGLERTYRSAGRPDRVIVLSTGETTEGTSAITRNREGSRQHRTKTKSASTASSSHCPPMPPE